MGVAQRLYEGIDLGSEYETARGMGVPAQGCYLAGVRGALCDDGTRAELTRIGDTFDWGALAVPAGDSEGE